MPEWWKNKPSILDLGADHYAMPLTKGDDHHLAGFYLSHPDPQGRECMGAVTLRGEGDGQPEWDLTSLDPLTLTPSVLCSCGDHGFITNGQWIPA